MSKYRSKQNRKYKNRYLQRKSSISTLLKALKDNIFADTNIYEDSYMYSIMKRYNIFILSLLYMLSTSFLVYPYLKSYLQFSLCIVIVAYYKSTNINLNKTQSKLKMKVKDKSLSILDTSLECMEIISLSLLRKVKYNLQKSKI